MANAQKYTRAACGHLAAHYERRKDEKGEYVKFGNQDIDPQKTHLNYNLAPRRGVEQIDFIRQRTTEARKESGFWGILAETTGRETQVSCSVGGDGIAQKIQKSRAVRGGDLR